MYFRILTFFTVLFLTALFGLTKDLPSIGGMSQNYDMGNLDEQMTCLAQAVYFEARGEPFQGQIAVAQVVRNRVTSAKKPRTYCQIVFAGSMRRNSCQFSFACDGKSDKAREQRSWKRAVRIAHMVAAGNLRDLSGQATHYHATYVSPKWAKSLTITATIGEHIFYR